MEHLWDMLAHEVQVILEISSGQSEVPQSVPFYTHYSDVISWFKNNKNKQNYKFILFDIKHFYLTITKELLSNRLCFATTKLQISKDDKKIIYH